MPPKKDIIQSFWEKAKKTDDPNKCWIWTGSKFGRGYGIIRRKTKSIRAHRVAYEITFGKIPEGLHVCHTCDNPLCVNPSHLFLGTAKDNSDDKIRKGRDYHSEREKHPLAKLTDLQVEEIRKRYIPRIVSVCKLAKEFGVSSPTIHRVIKRETWK